MKEQFPEKEEKLVPKVSMIQNKVMNIESVQNVLIEYLSGSVINRDFKLQILSSERYWEKEVMEKYSKFEN